MDSFSDRIDYLRKKREIDGDIKYGPINPVGDPRDFVKEMTDELLDALNYLEWAMLKGQLSICEWVINDRDIKFILYRLNRAKN